MSRVCDWRQGLDACTCKALLTRAQAEALLTLAEALEGCERQGVQVQEDTDGLVLVINDRAFWPKGHIDGMSVRLAVNDLVPNGC